MALLLTLPGAKAGDNAEAARESGKDLLYHQTLDQRIADISWKIAAPNVELCPDRMNSAGIVAHNAAQYLPRYRQAAIDSFGFGDGLPAVLAVAKDGPADRAGFRQGDRIAAIDGVALAPTKVSRSGKTDYASIDAIMARLENLPTGRPVAFDLIRGDAAIERALTPQVVCRTRVEVVGGAIAASSNGFAVRIYGKLAQWTKNDDELAIVIAHEMAHNILAHNARIAKEGIDTGIFAGLGSDGRKLRDIEREADRYGQFLVARAGYDYRLAPDFWRRLSVTAGFGGFLATTHPTAGNRAEFNRAVVAEIEGKKAAGGELRP